MKSQDRLARLTLAKMQESRRVIMAFLASDGTDKKLYEKSRAGLELLRHECGDTKELHRMRMAITAMRVDD